MALIAQHPERPRPVMRKHALLWCVGGIEVDMEEELTAQLRELNDKITRAQEHARERPAYLPCGTAYV